MFSAASFQYLYGKYKYLLIWISAMRSFLQLYPIIYQTLRIYKFYVVNIFKNCLYEEKF